MKTFDKSSKLDHVAYDIRGPVLDEANRMIAKGEKILRLNTGNPAEFGFTAPDEVIRDLIMNVRNSEGYSDSKGIFSARKAIMQYCQLKGFPNVDIDDIYIGNGVSEMISMSMQALLDDGDEVLVPMPDYPLWTACVSLAGGNAVHYVCDEKSNWYPDIDDIKSKITSNTKAIVVINPNNPTGSVLDKDVLKAFIERHTECCFVIDQSYEFFTLKPLLSAREAAGYPNVILLHSMTKRFAVPGLRLGFMTANQILLREIRLQRMPWSVNQLAIEAGHYLLRHAGEYHVDISLLLKEKDRLAEALLAIGGMEVWASDTHYMLVQLRMGRAAALKEYLAGECGILIRDASNFEGLNEHFFRIATQTPEENNELIESIKKWTYLY